MPPTRGPDRSAPSERITVHLGEDSLRQLNRVRQLLSDRDPYATIPSAGLTLRVAIRRLLLVLLGERANLADVRDPLTEEYLALYTSEIEDGQLPGMVLPDRRSGAAAGGRERIDLRRLKGGLD